ncbi:ribbon-helix-helix protein, CopG family [Crystallibacter degradans]|uniref:ribbon-helix-helix protein, CopG family n=1 Tax=Crystallibacter degradans TaxID=2726743 RepID=UPI00147390AB|nr:ribbon-helix-helix protein, CopG family [Arthrobacter sp. SF27]NMR28551.1 ribbon-helix-helix protein, CopG family [Arthrobacter sp. SF27]
MKTAISMPDKTFERADALAKSLGLSRSEFISRAVDHYADELERSSLTNRIDAAIESCGFDNDATTAVVGAGRATLSADGDEW